MSPEPKGVVLVAPVVLPELRWRRTLVASHLGDMLIVTLKSTYEKTHRQAQHGLMHSISLVAMSCLCLGTHRCCYVCMYREPQSMALVHRPHRPRRCYFPCRSMARSLFHHLCLIRQPARPAAHRQGTRHFTDNSSAHTRVSRPKHSCPASPVKVTHSPSSSRTRLIADNDQ